MRLRPDTVAMTVTLAVLTSLGPLSTDMYLPSLPWIALDFGTDEAHAQLTLSLFLVGFAAGQIVYGPLSDRYGRRPVLIAGLALFVVASSVCAFARSIEALIAMRTCQALGACAGVVLARAIVRDLYDGARAARLLSIMGALMGLVPAIAPVLGGVLQELYGWRANFLAVAAAAAAILAAVVVLLPETNKLRGTQILTFGSMFASFRVLLAASVFRHYVITAAASYGGLFAFISGSSFVFQGHYGMSVQGFSLVFGTAVLGYIAGTLLGARLTTRIGVDRTLRIGAFLLASSGVAMVALVFAAPAHFAQVLAPMLFNMAGVGLTLPQSMAGALTPFPDRAGAASSLLGAFQMTFGAIVGAIVGHSLGHGPATLAFAIAALGIVCLIAALLRK